VRCTAHDRVTLGSSGQNDGAHGRPILAAHDDGGTSRGKVACPLGVAIWVTDIPPAAELEESDYRRARETTASAGDDELGVGQGSPPSDEQGQGPRQAPEQHGERGVPGSAALRR